MGGAAVLGGPLLVGGLGVSMMIVVEHPRSDQDVPRLLVVVHECLSEVPRAVVGKMR